MVDPVFAFRCHFPIVTTIGTCVLPTQVQYQHLRSPFRTFNLKHSEAANIAGYQRCNSFLRGCPILWLSISSNCSLQPGAKRRKWELGLGSQERRGRGRSGGKRKEWAKVVWGVGSETSTGKEERDVAKDGGSAESKMIEEWEKIERQRAWSCYQSEAGASSRS